MKQREHFIIAPFFRTETPPLGAACLKAYLKQYDIEINVTDYRLQKNIVDTTSFTINHNLHYAGELSDLPLIQSILINHLTNKPLLDNFDQTIREFLQTRALSYFTLKRDINDIYRIFKRDMSRLKQYSLVGFTTYATNMFSTVLCACLLKQTNPNVTIVFGGPQVTESYLTSELVLRLGVADVVALSDGEEIFKRVIEADRESASLSVEGTLTFDETSQEIVKKTAPILDIQNLPCPDFSGMRLHEYSASPRVLPLYSSRGCPFKCEFCNEWKMWEKYRHLKVSTVIDWMNQLHQVYGTTTFHMADSLLNSSVPWIEEFADTLLSKGLKYQWYGYFRAKMTPKLSIKLKRAGLCRVFIGTEAFTDEMLVNMRKQRTSDDNISSAEAFCSAGIVLELGNVIGFPGETEKDFDARHQFYYALNDKYPGMFIANSEAFRLVPGSGVYADPDKFNIQVIPWNQKYIDAIPAISSVVEKIPMAINTEPGPVTIMNWMSFMGNFRLDSKSKRNFTSLVRRGDLENRIDVLEEESTVQFPPIFNITELSYGKFFELKRKNEHVCFMSKTDANIYKALAKSQNVDEALSSVQKLNSSISLDTMRGLLNKLVASGLIPSITNPVGVS